ncbi:MAG TPA: hypothetical protein VFR17_06575 [Mycobacterium sp.]|nr:hypothetical protein [Mycobacterium sp.]
MGSGSGSTGTGSNGGQILTGQYQQTHVENDYAVQNNAYNIGGGSQEIETTPAGFTLVSVAGSAPTNGAPLSYPSIFLGCAYTLCSIDSPLPEQLSDINSATSSIDYTYPTGGTWDASYDIWLDPQPLTNGVNQQEIMIWFNHQGSIQPVGHVVGDDDIDGKDFTVWEGSNGQNQVVSYVADTPISSWHNFNVLGFIDNTETLEPAMTDSWYLTSVQAGFEPWSGGAGLAINNFSANVNGTS